MTKAPKPTEAKPETPQHSVAARPIPPKEIGGPKGLEPTRYGDWERNGRVSDF